MYFKKKRLFLFFICFLFFVLVFLTGCNNNDVALDEKELFCVPSNLRMTADEYLNWDKVENATKYIISIEHDDEKEEYESLVNKFDTFEILNKYGTYTLRVKAIDEKNVIESDYSIPLEYEIESQENNIKFELRNNYCLASCSKNDELKDKLIIPEVYKDLPVSRVTFEYCKNIRSIIIPDSVYKIDSFYSLDNLTRIKISNEITFLPGIEKCPLLKELIVPNSVKTISKLLDVPSLEKLYIGEGVNRIVFEDVKLDFDCDIVVDDNNKSYKVIDNFFIGKNDDKLLQSYSNKSIPSCVKLIAENAFLYIETPEIIIPGNVIEIEKNAFESCKAVKKIKLEDGVMKIGIFQTSNSNIEEINISSTLNSFSEHFFDYQRFIKKINISSDNETYLEKDGLIFSKDESKLIAMVGNSLNEVNIQNTVKFVDEYAFSRSNIESVHIPSSVETLSASAFELCINLTNVTMDEGLTVIGKNCFYYCYNINSISLPNTLKEVGDYAFYNCSCPIIMTSILNVYGKSAFSTTTVYTNVDYISLNNHITKNRFYSLSEASFLSNCEFKDGYLYKYHYYKYSDDDRGRDRNKNYGNNEDLANYSSYYYGISYHKGTKEFDDFIVMNSIFVIQVPYREGYEFLGFSLNENSSDIVIGVESIEHSLLIKDDLVDLTCYSIRELFTLNNDTELYAVWKKIDN